MIVAGCATGTGSGDVTYTKVNDQWRVEDPKGLYSASMTQFHAKRAVERNPTKADVERNLILRDVDNGLTQAEVADITVIAAREACNIPDGTRITADTPCVNTDKTPSPARK
jgi:hypothetical protein